MSNKIITHIEALEKARSYCAYQERCQQEVIKKLRSFKLNEDELNYVLLQLIQGDYLNEERFAQAYVSGKIRIKKWGRRKIKHHLKQKGLTDKCIELGFKEISEDEYYETLKDLASYKWKTTKETNSYKKKQKVMSYLYGKGYESDLIQDVLKEIIAS
ncbi:regulatory protein RecX [Parvicella tangerina]|uniref:Regulatory protein RecX n=1 Tax=Parvicella tangerina TaxID=2829795 RepID=A0A916NA59_9FLAO|nr:regulatory protein RecX [Parvicella tangerina]CAG5078542.1 Regulatory protein RecX [Parvicella tangerina]